MSLEKTLAALEHGSHRWRKAARFLERDKRQLAALEMAAKEEFKPPMPSHCVPETQLPLPVFGEDLQAERAKLLAELTALEARGQKFLPGSPKTRANLAARADIERQIAALDRRIAAIPASPSAPQPVRTPKLPWTPERVAVLEKMWREGHSASTIAAALGGTRRNAVIGKAARLGLPFNYGKRHDTDEPA